MPLEPLTSDDAPIPQFDMGGIVERELAMSIRALEGRAPLMARMARYHLGMIDSVGNVTEPAVRRAVQGKRIRPMLALLTCSAVGGDIGAAAPLAAAIELLHNFTLIHDDIQDRSPNRRHRATVWRIWGDAQAINAGDAMFAAAQLTLLRVRDTGVPEGIVLDLLAEFNRITIELVAGQVLDLEYEGRADVSPHDYLSMISGKTAGIVRFAAWAGARTGGAKPEIAERLGVFGQVLGIGFQIQDDLLGIWGTRDITGKDAADDIRRRKQSLPILMLREEVSDAELARLNDLYERDEVDGDGVTEVLAALDRHRVRERVATQVRIHHDQALDELDGLARDLGLQPTEALRQLAERLGDRTF
ncbi:MAG TPA: polyprenyl synthetase family protein [Thermomicrobiales bacterium]|nr:polyprenyl synthetase family protein [Thermomicrobiales bacterium]